MKPNLRRLFIGLLVLTPLLVVAHSQASNATQDTKWDSTSDNVLEFPPKKRMRKSDFGDDILYMRGDDSLSAYFITPSSLSLLQEVERLKRPKVANSECTDAQIQEGRLKNGWEAAWVAQTCFNNRPYPEIVVDIEGGHYGISGNGLSISELLEYAGSGKIIPQEQRATRAEQKKRREKPDIATQLDRLSGGPAIRRLILVTSAIPVILLFAGVFLWRKGRAARYFLITLWVIYFLLYGWRGILLIVMSGLLAGVGLFGFPDIVTLVIIVAGLALSIVLALILSRRLKSPRSP
ncbi:MAG: hypothetical protein PHP45_02105 [Elusimicrobiales bacterium]|nr:hypothetical protein [Elusimicrobiales bacterium]